MAYQSAAEAAQAVAKGETQFAVSHQSQIQETYQQGSVTVVCAFDEGPIENGPFAGVEGVGEYGYPYFRNRCFIMARAGTDEETVAELKALVILAILVVSYLLSRATDLFVVGAIFCCLGFLVYFRYNTAKNLSKHPEEFGHGSVEGVAAAESANNAVTGATLIPLLTLGIPGDGTVAIMLSALMINGLNPGLSLFTTDGDIMYAIMLGLILVNLFMFLQGKFLTSLFAKVVSIPQEILTPIIVIFCFAGAYSVNENYFDVAVALVFGVLAWVLRKLDLPPVPILLGLVLGRMTETNFRRALLISNGDPSIFVQSIYCKIFLALIIVAVNMLLSLLFGKLFHFNLEEIILASNANIGGPTTAAAMAISKGWNQLIGPVMLVGVLGYVLGNYFGILAGTLLAGF